MSYGQSAPTAACGTRPTVYRARRHVPLGPVFAVLLAATAFAAASQLLSGNADPLSSEARPFIDNDRASVSLAGWPQQGFTITVSGAEARAAAQDRDEGQSVVAVQVDERLTERELLEALLIPSGNNIAELLATVEAGSETRFIAEMNGEARALGMDHTTYTDPSGFDPSTVSTPADQLRAFQQAMRFQVFRQIVSMGSVTLPVAGTVTNFNPLIAEGYAGKTGSDSAAGGCLAFFTDVTVGGRRQTAAGVVPAAASAQP